MNGTARGEQYWDDGTTEMSEYAEIVFKFENNVFTAELDDTHSSVNIRTSAQKYLVDRVYFGGQYVDYDVEISVNNNDEVIDDEVVNTEMGPLGDFEVTFNPPVDVLHYKLQLTLVNPSNKLDAASMNENERVIEEGMRRLD